MNDDPRSTLHRAVEGVEHSLDVDTILAAAEARGRRRRGLAIGAAATLTLSLTVAYVGLSTSGAPHRNERNLAASHSFGDWVPQAEVLGTPAPMGSLVYLQGCAEGECKAFLRSATGETFPLDSVSEEAARLIETDPAHATLSYDGRWVGANSATGAYTLINLEDDSVVTVDSPDGQPMTPQGWSEQSTYFTVQQSSPGGSTVYVSVRLIPSPKVGSPVSARGDDGTLQAAVHGGSGVVFLTSRDEPGAERFTSSRPGDKNLVLDLDGHEPGAMLDVGPSESLAECMKRDESLTGPSGVPVISTPPLSSERFASIPMSTYLVFDASGQPSAAISKSCAGSEAIPTGYYKLPGDHRVLGALPDGMFAVRSHNGEVLAVGPDQEPRALVELPSDTTVILPGSPTVDQGSLGALTS